MITVYLASGVSLRVVEPDGDGFDLHDWLEDLVRDGYRWVALTYESGEKVWVRIDRIIGWEDSPE